MIETKDIKLRTFTCDVPGCAAVDEVADHSDMGYGPANWTSVKVTAHDALTLCPKHAEWRPLLRTVLLALDRRDAAVGEGRS